MDTRRLLTYISGRATQEEKAEVLDWIEASEEHTKLFCGLKNHWVVDSLNNLDKQDSQPKRGPRRVFYVYAAAAVVLVALISVLGTSYLSTRVEILPKEQQPVSFTYVVNTGVKGVVELPDGSKVWLNSASYLKCPQQFGSLVREIEMEGEGFFDVVSDKEWPMLIKTSKGYTLRVTGTTFNLSSYSDDNKLVVTLVSGEVSLINNKNRDVVKLQPTQELVVLDKIEQKASIKPANVELNTAWKEGLLIFDNAPMIDVVKKLKRWYGVDILVEDGRIFDYRFTAKFASESITQVLDILRLSSNIQYAIEDTTVTLYREY